MLGVYVHIPFCEKKCNYCAFSSFVCQKEEQERYVEFLIQEIQDFDKKYPNKRNIDTVFIGGGTPSLLPPDLLLKIVKAIKENFIIDDNYEFTIECNPSSLNEEKLKAYKELGANRLSIGVQSLDDEKLNFIGRVHNSKGAIEKIKLARKYFDNISCDMLLGLKDMEKEVFLKELNTLIDLDIKHISTYMLQVEEGTPLQKMVEQNSNLLPSDEECIEVYDETAKFLAEKGFERYEISNFALKGYESKHNLKYWSGEEYIGFGLSAHSYLDGKRFSNASSFEDYYCHGQGICETLSNKELIEEHIMLGLRCKLGISKDYLKELGFDIEKSENINFYLENNILVQEGDRIYINPSYYGIDNYIISSIF